MLRPDKAFFVSEKKEFFLTLNDALSYDDPIGAILEFLHSSFDILQEIKRLDNLDWIIHPLSYEE